MLGGEFRSPGCAMSLTSARHRATRGALALAAAAACLVTLLWSDAPAEASPPSIGFHIVSAGGGNLRNPCYRLRSTSGQAAPGYSSSSPYSVLAGFWSAAPTTGRDEIFFNSFEAC
jgi:hypothetical protein